MTEDKELVSAEDRAEGFKWEEFDKTLKDLEKGKTQGFYRIPSELLVAMNERNSLMTVWKVICELKANARNPSR